MYVELTKTELIDVINQKLESESASSLCNYLEIVTGLKLSPLPSFNKDRTKYVGLLTGKDEVKFRTLTLSLDDKQRGMEQINSLRLKLRVCKK